LSCSGGRIHVRTVTKRLKASRERHSRAICGAPLHVWSGVRVSPKKAPWAITGQRRMHSSSPKGKQTALSSVLPSESTADNEKYVKTAAEKGNQMRPKGSNEVVGRIDTRRNVPHRPREKSIPLHRYLSTPPVDPSSSSSFHNHNRLGVEDEVRSRGRRASTASAQAVQPAPRHCVACQHRAAPPAVQR